MKKLIILNLLLLVFGQVISQGYSIKKKDDVKGSKLISSKGTTYLGGRIGLGLNGYGYPAATGFTSLLNLTGVSEFVLGDKFALQPELLYASKGYNGQSGSSLYEVRLNYLGLNLIPKFKWEIDQKYEFYIQAGLGIDIALSGTQTENYFGTIKSNDLKPYMTSTIGNLILGGGFSYYTTSGKFVVDLRRTGGFADCVKNQNENSLYQNTISLGFMFKL